MPQFFTNDAVSLEKSIDLNSKIIETSQDELYDIYDIQKCCEWIQSNNFEKVCLQFPDHLLADSTEVATCIQELLGQTIYVLGDTAYESCCIDYVAAAHINADAIIHFGPTCFSKTLSEIPYLYVYEKHKINLPEFDVLLTKFCADNEKILLVLDTEYIHMFDSIEKMASKQNHIQIQSIDSDLQNLDDNSVLYMGNNLRKLLNLDLTFKMKCLYTFDPQKQPYEITKYETNSNILKRRYFLIEKIRDAQTLGIVIGTLGVKNYIDVISRIKKLIELNKKKYYLISVGKPTVAKLANFAEIDIYIMITCSMNEIFENRDFFKPIVTPFDVEVALNTNSSDLRFSFDYNRYLNNLKNINIIDDTDVSLLTGQLRSSSSLDDSDKCNNQVVLKNEGTVALNTNYGAGFLSERSWKGLEQNLGQTEVTLAQEGKKGIAQGYQNEQL